MLLVAKLHASMTATQMSRLSCQLQKCMPKYLAAEVATHPSHMLLTHTCLDAAGQAGTEGEMSDAPADTKFVGAMRRAVAAALH